MYIVYNKMVNKLHVVKLYTDLMIKQRAGEHFGNDSFDKIVSEDTDCYWTDEAGKEHLLFKFRKNAIPAKHTAIARTVYEQVSKPGSIRSSTVDNNFVNVKKTKGNSKMSFRSNKSKISGYYDRPTVKNSNLKTQVVCRTTAFTRDNFDKWESVLPFFEIIGNLYKKLAPVQYKKQLVQFKKTPPGMQVGNTPFSTITSNYNWRTAMHKDKGDYSGGLGNLCVLGDDTFEGGFLGFPQFRVAIDVRPSDFVLMDVHQWHCNTPLKADHKNVRLSFVCYFREQMVQCNKKKTINGETIFYKG